MFPSLSLFLGRRASIRRAPFTLFATLLVLSGMILHTTASSAGTPRFGAPLTFATGARPFAVAIGDQNGDGLPDLATANATSSDVSVLLHAPSGAPGGLFAGPSAYATGTTPFAIAMGDLNGDGIPDLAVANSQATTVSVLLGLGGGTYGAKRDFTIGIIAHDVKIADLDADGRPDLVVANEGSNSVSVLLGLGDGTFAPAVDYASGTWPVSVAIGDLNADGALDLAVANSFSAVGVPGTVSVLLGVGDGTFLPRADLPVAPQDPLSVEIADVNDDGRPDLAVSTAGNVVSVRLGIGDGTFGTGQSFSTGEYPVALAIVDLDGDGRPDLATANRVAGTVSVLMGRNDGTFGIATDFAVGSDVTDIAAGDLDGDGRPDLVVTDAVANVAAVLINFPAPPPPPPPALFGPAASFATGRGPISVAIGDLNGDGLSEVAVANVSDHTVSVLPGGPHGTFGAKTDYGVGIAPTCVVFGDQNNDFNLDLLVVNNVSNTVTLMLGLGDGTVGNSGGYSEYPTGARPTAARNSDLDGDGYDDLVVTNSGDNSISILPGLADGSFGPRHDIAVGQDPRSVALNDFDQNGYTDLAVAESGDHAVSVLLAQGDGTFAPKQSFATGVAPAAVVCGDLNGDGYFDLVTANTGNNNVSVLLSNGDGTFAEHRDYPVGEGPMCVAIGDLDSDGMPDVVVGTIGAHVLSVLMGDGGGVLKPVQTYPIAGSAWSVAIADLNDDGLPDVVTADHSSNTVSVLLNTSQQPTPTIVELFRAIPEASGIRIEWQMGDPGGFRSVELQRAASATGAWVRVAGAPDVEGARFTVLDDAVPAGQPVWYRLSVVTRAGRLVTFGPIPVTAPGGVPSLELSAISPNPSDGRANVAFAIPTAAHVRLTVTDVQGREVARLADRPMEPGRYVAALDATDLRPGVFFVRLQAGAVIRARRLVITR